MKTDKKLRQLPAASHVSEAVRRANPHLFQASAVTAIPMIEIRKKRGEKGTRKPNETEMRMWNLLEARKRRGEIEGFLFEGMSLKFSVDTKTGACQSYKADFVVFSDRQITLIEVKGGLIREKDRNRFKSCRADWPQFVFEMHQWENRTWTRVL